MVLDNFSQTLSMISTALPIVNWEVSPLRFPISGQEMYLITVVVSITAYIGVSLLTCKKEFNLDKMLHRGIYNLEHTVKDATEAEREAELKRRKIFNWRALLGSPRSTPGATASSRTR